MAKNCVSCDVEKPESSFHLCGKRLFLCCIECGKTGTLKPPRMFRGDPDFRLAQRTAEKKCERTRQDTVIFHDERLCLSIAHVNNLGRLKKVRNILFGYNYNKMTGKVEGGAICL